MKVVVKVLVINSGKSGGDDGCDSVGGNRGDRGCDHTSEYPDHSRDYPHHQI